MGKMKRLLLFLIAVMLLGCSKSEEYRIPYYPVYLELDLAFEDKALLNYNTSIIYNSKNTSAIERTGFGGVIVYHSSIDMGHGEYVAYDLACPYEASSSTKISPDDSGLYAVCPACKSKYELTYGFPEKGSVSTYRLQLYSVYKQSDSKLIVQN